MTTPFRFNASVRCLFAVLAVAMAVSARADGYLSSPYTHRDFLLSLGWEVAAPMLDLRSQFIDATSTTGLDLGMRHRVGTRLSAGVDLTWNRFAQSSTLGDRFGMDAVALRGVVHYYFSPSEIQPYAGFGLGGVYREAILNGGPSQAGFGLSGAPEIGVLMTFAQGAALNVSARYEVTTASFDVNGDPNWHVNYPSWVGIQVGLALY